MVRPAKVGRRHYRV